MLVKILALQLGRIACRCTLPSTYTQLLIIQLGKIVLLGLAGCGRCSIHIMLPRLLIMRIRNQKRQIADVFEATQHLVG
jgi:hypothetical protein